ncbi:MAG: hypothetical protein MHM6MM_008298, partial [Cercozoa sp. M6MM]
QVAPILRRKSAFVSFTRKMVSRGGVSGVHRVLTQHPLVRNSDWLRYHSERDESLALFLLACNDDVFPRHDAMNLLPRFRPEICDLVRKAILESDFATVDRIEPRLTVAAFWRELSILCAAKCGLHGDTRQRLERAREMVHQHATLGPVWERLDSSVTRITRASTERSINIGRVVVFLSTLDAFRSLTRALEQGATCYLPCQPEDTTAMAIRALGGRWYLCPNGHEYHVDACGRPMETLNCLECGASIGGNNHNLLASNVDVDSELRGSAEYFRRSRVRDSSPKGYAPESLQQEQQAGEALSVRGLPTMSFRVMRILLHSLLCLSEHKQTYLQRDLQLRLEEDWRVLHEITTLSYEELGLRVQHFLSTFRDPDISLTTLEGRAEWERRVALQVDSAWSVEMSVLVSTYEPKEIDDRTSLRDESIFAQKLVGNVTERSVYTVRQRARVEDIQRHLSFQSEERRTQLQLLCRFCDQLDLLSALSHLSSAFAVMHAAYKRYDRRVSQVTARAFKVGDLIADEGMQSQFEGFCRAWNTIWPHVDRYECRELPQQYKDMTMDESVKLAFVLPCEKDEGICALAAMGYLADLHNWYVEAARGLLSEENDENPVASV